MQIVKKSGDTVTHDDEGLIPARKKTHRRALIEKVHPNEWNPNVMDAAMFKKLKSGLKRTIEQSGEIPPIVVRKSRQKGYRYEIIDGYHRWKALGELGEKKVDVFVLSVDDKTARILTNTLNYLRGQPDRAKYAKGLVELIEIGASMDDPATYLPNSGDDISLMLEEADISLKAYENLSKDSEGDDANEDDYVKGGYLGATDDDTWIDVKFRVTVSQAKVIEDEIARLSGVLRGKNSRARALEMMAAQSASTPLPHDLT